MTLSPADTGSRAVDWTREHGEETRPLPVRSPLPRPDVADTDRIILPRRVALFLADDATLTRIDVGRRPVIDLAAAQPIAPLERLLTEAPPEYIGRHRDPLGRHAKPSLRARLSRTLRLGGAR